MADLNNMPFDDRYLNKTVNRYPRKGKDDTGKPYEYGLPVGTVVHETATKNPTNPHGTLKFNLTDPPGTSYDALIARDERPDGYATIYRYNEARTHISYHAGVNSNALGYSGWLVNVYLTGVELDGRNNGEELLASQIRSLQLYAQWQFREYGIIISSANYLPHSVVAPRDKNGNIYKTDPRARNFSPRLIDEAGLKFEAAPRITLRAFMAALTAISSPITPEGEAIYREFVNAGIDPGVALAFAYHEHKLGTVGIIPQYNLKNWGAVRTPWATKAEIVSTPSGTFARYRSWLESAVDWIARIKGRYIARGLFTVELALPVYAPSSDRNNPAAYTRAVYRYIDAWDNEPEMGQIPTGDSSTMLEVPAPIARYWEASGREWQGDRYALGFIQGSESRADGQVFIFQRGRLRLNPNGSIDAMLLDEA